MTKGCGISNKIPNIQTGKIQSIIKSNDPLNSYTSTYEILTTHKMIRTGASGAVRGTHDYRGSTELLLVWVTNCSPTIHKLKSQAFPEVCSEQVHCANAFRIGSNKSPFTIKFCTCSLIAFTDFLLVCGQWVVLIFVLYIYNNASILKRYTYLLHLLTPCSRVLLEKPTSF
jgi:hypothetical protein